MSKNPLMTPEQLRRLPFPVPELSYETERRCEDCRVVRPVANFRGDARTCDMCVADEPRKQKLARQHQSAKFASQRLVASVRGSKINAPHISELCEAIVEQFDGLHNFAKIWKQQIDIAIANSPGSKTVLDSFYGITKLIAVSTEHRGSAPDVADLTDEELAIELEAIGRRLIRSNVLSIESEDADEPLDPAIDATVGVEDERHA